MEDEDRRIETLVARLGRDGDREALNELVGRVYEELHTLAHRHLARRRSGQTLNTTALVNEAYVKLAGRLRSDLVDRSHFLAVAATVMRHILVDHARASGAAKRGGGAAPAAFEVERLGVDPRPEELLALDQALERLEALDGRLARLVELRFFGGLTGPETAAVLGISERTVKRDWQKARALLHRLLSDETEEAPDRIARQLARTRSPGQDTRRRLS